MPTICDFSAVQGARYCGKEHGMLTSGGRFSTLTVAKPHPTMCLNQANTTQQAEISSDAWTRDWEITITNEFRGHEDQD